MKVCVFGLWHLGCVTAACLAELGLHIVGLDFDENNIVNLNMSKAPLFEPGLNDLINKNLGKNLTFTTDAKAALENSDFLWLTFDTPVDENDAADAEYVIGNLKKVFPCFNTDIGIIISSQLPVRTTRQLKQFYYEQDYPYKPIFSYSPENLRLGKAIDIFLNPDRIVIGVEEEDRPAFSRLFSKISQKNG